MNIEKVLKQIDVMSREEFLELIQTGVLRSHEFAMVATAGLPYLSRAEKRRLCTRLAATGLEVEYGEGPEYDSGLEKVVLALAGRAAQIR